MDPEFSSLIKDSYETELKNSVLCQTCHSREYFMDQRFSSLYFSTKVTPVPKPSVDRPRYKNKKKIKTNIIVLTLCLNVGTPPPGVNKPENCAVEECWYDPNVIESKSKAVAYIGRRLQKQYENLSKMMNKIHIKQLVDPTNAIMENNCKKIRGIDSDNILEGRLVYHYNGHGVPDPTPSGEIWVFDPNYNQYVPISIYVLHSWLRPPCLYIFDCNNAGVLLPHFNDIEEQNNELDENILVLAACDTGQKIPSPPCLPCDLFTSCLTTPLHMSIRWYSSVLMFFRLPGKTFYQDKQHVYDDIFAFIPGDIKQKDTPLGKLQWILDSITDTIAWDCIDTNIYQTLYRKDEITATLFRNFLLAQHILGWFDVTPVSKPALPNVSKHPLWNTWWSILDDFFYQFNNSSIVHSSLSTPFNMDATTTKQNYYYNSIPLPVIKTAAPPDPSLFTSISTDMNNRKIEVFNNIFRDYTQNSAFLTNNDFQFETDFFINQMKTFELEFPLYKSHPEMNPQQLPMLYHIFLGEEKDQVLPLLAKYTLQGPDAIELILSTGFYNYFIKCIQLCTEKDSYLLTIWSRILLYDYTYQSDLISSRCFSFFNTCLTASYNELLLSRKRSSLHRSSLNSVSSDKEIENEFLNYSMQQEDLPDESDPVLICDCCSSLICLSLICHQFLSGQLKCYEYSIHQTVLDMLSYPNTKLQKWSLLFLSEMIDGNKTVKQYFIEHDYVKLILSLVTSHDAEVRASALLVLGFFIGYNNTSNHSMMKYKMMNNRSYSSSSYHPSYQNFEIPLRLSEIEKYLETQDCSSVDYDIYLLREVRNQFNIRSELSALVRREYLRLIYKVFVQPIHRSRLIFCLSFIKNTNIQNTQNHCMSISNALNTIQEDDHDYIQYLSPHSPLTKEQVLRLKPSFYVENWLNLNGLLIEEPITILIKSLYKFRECIRNNALEVYPNVSMNSFNEESTNQTSTTESTIEKNPIKNNRSSDPSSSLLSPESTKKGSTDYRLDEDDSNVFLLPPTGAYSSPYASSFGNFSVFGNMDLNSSISTSNSLPDSWLETQLTYLALPTTLFSVNIDILSNNNYDEYNLEKDPSMNTVPEFTNNDRLSIASKKQKQLYRNMRERIIWSKKDVPVTCAKFHPSAPYILFGGLQSITAYHLLTGNLVFPIQHVKAQTTSIDWVNNTSDPLLAEARSNGSISIWKSPLKDKKKKARLLSSFSLFTEFSHNFQNDSRYIKRLLIKWDPVDGYLIAGGNSKYVKIVDFSRQQLLTRFNIGNTRLVTSIDTNRCDSRYFFTTPKSLMTYDVREGIVRSLYTSPTADTNDPIIKCSMNSLNSIYVGQYNGIVKKFDLRTEKSLFEIQTANQLTDIKVHPYLPFFAVSSFNSTIATYTYDGEKMQTITAHSGLLSKDIGPILSIEYNKENNCLVSINSKGECTFYSQD